MQKGSIVLDKRFGYWMFRWREYPDGKAVRRSMRLESVKDYPSIEALRKKWQPFITRKLEGLSVPRLTADRKKRQRVLKEGVDRYEEMVRAQAGRCAICKEFPDQGLCIDHDHLTGKIRALLCRRCNMAIGLMRESASILTAAAEYLRQHNGVRAND